MENLPSDQDASALDTSVPESGALDKSAPDAKSPPKFGDGAATQGVLVGFGSHIQSSKFEGPIPPPEMLAQYNGIIPNGADRILAMAERQEEHRQRLERAVVEGGTARAWLGLLLGFVLGLVGLVGSIFLIYAGRDISGLAIFLASLGSLIGVFVYQTKEREKERLSRSRTRRERPTAKTKG